MNSWSNSIDLQTLQKIFSLQKSYQTTVAMGFSMGGSNALILGPAIGAQIVIAFSPQFTVHPDYRSEAFDKFRLLRRKPVAISYIERICSWKYITVDHAPKAATKTFIFHGDVFFDIASSIGFSRFSKPGRICLTLKQVGHNISKELAKAGILSPLIDLCFHGSSKVQLEECIASAGFDLYDNVDDLL